MDYTRFGDLLHSLRHRAAIAPCSCARHNTVPRRGLRHADAAGGDGFRHGYRTRWSHSDLRSRSEVDSRSRAHAERFVRSIKDECLNRVVPLGERHLRRALAEYVAHYHGERNHQGLGNELIDRSPTQQTRGPVRRRQRMGGILSHYYRSAA